MDSDSDENLEKDGGPFITHIYVADGLQKDFKNIIKKFLELDSIRYEFFVKLWEELHMDEIFSSRPTFWELAEFSEEAVRMAASYMFEAANNNFKEAVAGLYLTYRVYTLQPIENFAKIKMSIKEVECFDMIKQTARTRQEYDVLNANGGASGSKTQNKQKGGDSVSKKQKKKKGGDGLSLAQKLEHVLSEEEKQIEED